MFRGRNIAIKQINKQANILTAPVLVLEFDVTADVVETLLVSDVVEVTEGLVTTAGSAAGGIPYDSSVSGCAFGGLSGGSDTSSCVVPDVTGFSLCNVKRSGTVPLMSLK